MSTKLPQSRDELIPTRQSLLGRLKDWDDQQSWQDFFNTYWKLIYGVAVKSGLTDAEAQDVVQETVIAAAKNLKEFKYDPAIGSFKAWLLNQTRWRIADQFRKRQRHPEQKPRGSDQTSRTSTEDRLVDPASLDVDAVWETEWKKNLFKAALDRLRRKVKPLHYQIFDCYVVKQWPVRQVTKTLGISIAQVYMVKHRLSAQLKKEAEYLETRML